MNTEAYYHPNKVYPIPGRLFNFGRVMFVICLILTTLIVIVASSRG